MRARVLEVGDPVILHEGPLAALVEQGEQVCTELLNRHLLRILQLNPNILFTMTVSFKLC